VRSGRAAQIEEWLMALLVAGAADIGPDDGPYAAPLPDALVDGTPEDFAAAHFRFSGVGHGANYPRHHLVHVRFAPDLRHRAVTVRRADWDGSLLWLDGRVVPVPRGDRGPLADEPGHWADDSTYAVPVGGLWDHPLHDPRLIATLGTIFSLLVCDVARGTQTLLVPRDDEGWYAPRLVRRDGTFVVDPGEP
jgi:hypothetical protein